MDYPGKVIRKTPVTPTQTSASGVWTVDDALQAVKTNTWPIAGVPNPISKSLRFNSADTAYLNRTPSSAGNRKTWTWSGWVKRSALGASTYFFGAYSGSGSDTTLFTVSFNSSDQLDISAFTQNWRVTSQVFRDIGAWYHIVIAFDTTQATAGDRIKLYVNGTQVTAFGTSNNPTQNTDYVVNNTVAHYVGVNPFTGNSAYFNGYMTEINFIDGQALTPSDFGLTDPQTGAWIPKKYTGTYGTNGFYVNFKDNSSTGTLGYDYSGNSNNWTANNFSVTAGAGNDSLVDVPTPWIAYNTTGDVGGVVRGNYSTLNPLWSNTITLSNGNLQGFGGSGGTGDVFSTSTIGMSSGKWYCEVLYAAKGGASALNVGIIERNTNQNYPDYGYYSNNGNKYNDLSSSAYGASWDVNDVIGISYDADVGTLVFYKNGVSQGTAFSGISGTYFFCQARFGSDSHTTQWNFGQRPFAYTPPAGFLSLCTTNLPTPTIGATSTTQANDYFDIVTYTGTGSSNSITGYGFQPDLVWIKSTVSSFDHAWYDAVRGVQKQIESNTTTAETTETTGLTAFNSDGFTVGTSTQVNTSTSYIAWAWKANGAGSTNNAGSIQSTVSANTTAGFSVVTYTGNGGVADIGHGLGVKPSFILTKTRNNTEGWGGYHISLGASYGIFLDLSDAAYASAGYWNNTEPNATTFTVNANPRTGANGYTYVAYCFAPVAGYSAFGSYTGNGSTDGPMVFTGFRPRWTLFKRTDTGSTTWVLYDTKRNPYNIVNDEAYPALNSGFGTADRLDILSNGFKMRNTISELNANGGTYIYAAFAEFPFKFSNAR